MYIGLGIICLMIIMSLLYDIINDRKKRKLPKYFGKTLNKTGHPFIMLYNGNKPFVFLVDTGSTHNIIDITKLNELDSKFVRKENMHVTGINSSETISNDIYRIRLDDTLNSFTDDFISMDLKDMFKDEECQLKNSVAGILGVGFLSKYALTLDFKNNIIT